MKRLALFFLLVVGCGPQGTQAPAIVVAASCELNGIQVEVERGAGLQQYAIGYRVPGISGVFAADPSVTDPSRVPGGLWGYDFNGVYLGLAEGCAHYAHVLQFYRSIYEARWGVQDLDGWKIRIRAGRSVSAVVDAAGATWIDDRFIDLTTDGLQYFPHELHHEQLGAGSADHHGWCLEYEPWEESTLAISERSYLRCT